MSDTFTGRADILDTNGLLVDVGKAILERQDPETGATWGGVIRVYKHAALAQKTMPAILRLSNGEEAKALVGPQVGGIVEGELIDLDVTPLQSEVPF
ncbi:MAG: hypothetical protein R3246_03330 [Acidimicrobiia bacterium]|nr:hypothetical protein [Acidimicrobiia bacterium]